MFDVKRQFKSYRSISEVSKSALWRFIFWQGTVKISFWSTIAYLKVWNDFYNNNFAYAHIDIFEENKFFYPI
jgi:hypothetical protein